MPLSHSSSSSSASSRSSHSSGSSRSSASSRSSSREEVRSTKVPLPRNHKALSCIVWFAGANPGLVKHIRRDEITYTVESNRDGRGRRNSDERTKSRWHFVKVTDRDYEDDDDYSSRRSFRPRGAQMGYGGGGGGGRPGGQQRRPGGASEFGPPPPWVAGQGGPAGPGGPGRFPVQGIPGGTGGPGGPGGPGGLRMPEMPMPGMPAGPGRFPLVGRLVGRQVGLASVDQCPARLADRSQECLECAREAPVALAYSRTSSQCKGSTNLSRTSLPIILIVFFIFVLLTLLFGVLLVGKT